MRTTAQEHLGTVSSASMDITATGKAPRTKAPGASGSVFQAEGNKGKGEVTPTRPPAKKFHDAR